MGRQPQQQHQKQVSKNSTSSSANQETLSAAINEYIETKTNAFVILQTRLLTRLITLINAVNNALLTNAFL
jgi:hypothetical protein